MIVIGVVSGNNDHLEVLMSDRKTVKTAAKAVIIENGRILLLQKRGDDGTFHVLPGGKQQFGETLTTALQRECREELDINVSVGKLVFIREYIGRKHEFAKKHHNLHKVEFFFICSREPGPEPGWGIIPDETQEGFIWLPLESLNTISFYPKELVKWLHDLHYDEHDHCRYLGDLN